MTIRGVHKPGSSFVTSAMRGICKERLATRAEVMSLIFGRKSLTLPEPHRCPCRCWPISRSAWPAAWRPLLAIAPWRVVPPAFFRTHCQVILGLLVLAALDRDRAAVRAGRLRARAAIGVLCVRRVGRLGAGPAAAGRAAHALADRRDGGGRPRR